MSQISELPQYLPINDIPDNITKELERLHDVLMNADTQERKDWAQKMIANILSITMSGAIFLPEVDL